MAVRTDASGDYLRKTTGLLDYQQPYTVAFWYSLAANTAAGYQGICTLSGNGGNYDEFFLDGSGNFSLECSGSTPTTVDGRAPIADRWYHIALVRRTTSLMEVYVDGVLDITNTANVGSRGIAIANLSFGSNAFSEWTNGRFTNAKAWQAALTRTEIIAERAEFAQLRQANIHAWWPMLPGARTVDWSGVGNPLTEGGTLTDEAGPLPVAPALWFVPFAIDAAVTLAPNVTDAVTVTETVTLRIPALLAGVTDAATIAETVTAKPVTAPASTDSIAVGEAASASVQPVTPRTANVTDAVTVGEATTVRIPRLLTSVTDSVTVSEAASASIQLAGATNASATDSVTAGEAATANAVTRASVSDAATLAETATVTAVTRATVNDGVTVADAASMAISAPLATATDAVTVGEAVTAIVSVAGVLQISVTDAVTVGESVTVSIQTIGVIPVSIDNGVTVTEGVAVVIKTATVSVTDEVATLDSVTVRAAIFISVTDAVTVTDALTVAPPHLQLSVNDDIQVNDVAYGQASGYYVSVGDTVTLVDLVALSFITIGLVDATVYDYATWKATLSDSAVWRKTLGDAAVWAATLSDVDRT